MQGYQSSLSGHVMDAYHGGKDVGSCSSSGVNQASGLASSPHFSCKRRHAIDNNTNNWDKDLQMLILCAGPYFACFG